MYRIVYLLSWMEIGLEGIFSLAYMLVKSNLNSNYDKFFRWVLSIIGIQNELMLNKFPSSPKTLEIIEREIKDTL